LGVDIYHQGYKLVSCRSRNIGLGGTYIDTQAQDHNLHCNDKVELVFHVSSGASFTKYALYAQVVRIEQHGIGLRFNVFDTGVFRSLQQLMSYRRGVKVQHG
jgi:hypothetical protein